MERDSPAPGASELCPPILQSSCRAREGWIANPYSRRVDRDNINQRFSFHCCTDRVLTGYANPEPGVYCGHIWLAHLPALVQRSCLSVFRAFPTFLNPKELPRFAAVFTAAGGCPHYVKCSMPLLLLHPVYLNFNSHSPAIHIEFEKTARFESLSLCQFFLVVVLPRYPYCVPTWPSTGWGRLAIR